MTGGCATGKGTTTGKVVVLAGIGIGIVGAVVDPSLVRGKGGAGAIAIDVGGTTV
jgi:hypothetical protein